ncbi:unnamed protein product [Clavelina lepadiformis]|uniref:Uncharacterized protein n=1 Tax=Clavelina lepadiformis TaxID=159417 RepID=A0ABP0F066_CLALP
MRKRPDRFMPDVTETRAETEVVKSYLRVGKSIIASVVVPALVKLVARGGDDKTISMADEFSLVLEESGTQKSFSLYKDRRFIRLGHTAGALVDCVLHFKKMLSRTSKNNLLVRACSLYLENEFIVASLKALSHFCHKVTMPYLNMVERCQQSDLVRILPKLYKNLERANLETLSEFHVPWKHVNAESHSPTTDLDHYLVTAMAKQSALGLKMQCGREYWEDETENSERSTRIHALTEEMRVNLPTENLLAERYLARFGNLAGHSNRYFKAKRIKDDLMFAKDAPIDSELASCKVMKKLDEMEITWTETQKESMKTKLKERIKKNKREVDFLNHLVDKCKGHGGPITKVEELRALPTTSSSTLKSSAWRSSTNA